MAADSNIRESEKEWAKPTWAQVVSGSRKGGNNVKGSVGRARRRRPTPPLGRLWSLIDSLGLW
jgi:hypothetical protein